jgi:hypothetical protein
MNIKLLKELYKQAETECGWSEEKFAELIVRECADVAGRDVGHFVLKHFGVEDTVQNSNLHTCPYAEEIHNDYETLCDCDEEATRQCAMDV